MAKYKLVCVMFPVLVFCTSGRAQSITGFPGTRSKPLAGEIKTAPGPNSITRNIIQDRKGTIWIASWEGVFKYDGKSFTNITAKVSSARFFSLLEDREGNLWFGSIGSGVYRYDGHSFKNFTIKDGLLNNDVGCIYEDKKGHIWFGVFGGASRYDPSVTAATGRKLFRNYIIDGEGMNEDRSGRTFPTRPQYEVTSMVEDRKGKFWFATRGNTFVYDGAAFAVVTHDGKPFRNVRCIIEDQKGQKWLGGNDGLWRYGGLTSARFTEKFVGHIFEDRRGHIWTSSVSAGNQNWAISRYEEKLLYNGTFVDGMARKPKATEIKSDEGMTFGILEASDGSIWFGTLNGVKRYDGKTVTDFK